jgi:hypothetical protein
VALLSLATGLLVSWVTGHWYQHELMLLQSLWDELVPGDVLLGDRGFCSWGLLAQCLQRKVHGVFRVRGARRRDFRQGRRLSRDERLVQWAKPRLRPGTVSPEEWARLPEVLKLRLVRCRLTLRGFRTREVILVTTLLDAQSYPPKALGQLYYRRWTMELTLRNLKSTLQMEHLSCKTPANLEREIRMHFLVHNLVRRLMLESARRYHVPLERISFAGALAGVRRFGEALLQARSERQRRQLREELFRVLAADLVPDRPGRREPRAVKRRKQRRQQGDSSVKYAHLISSRLYDLALSLNSPDHDALYKVLLHKRIDEQNRNRGNDDRRGFDRLGRRLDRL